jgi:hypothetical protein
MTQKSALMPKGVTGLACAAALLFAGVSANAGSTAMSSFSLSGTTLTVTLSATGNAASVPSGVLTGIFFSANDENLTPLNAALSSGSSLLNPVSGESIGGNWQYAGGKSGLPLGATAGIVTTGLGIFGPTGNFGTPATILDGIGYGIVNGISSGANSKVQSSTLINNGLVFTLTVPSDFDINSITDVSYQFGTSLGEGSTPPPSVPDGGSTLALMGVALLGITCVRRKLAWV